MTTVTPAIAPGPAATRARAMRMAPASTNTIIPGSTSRASAAPSAALASGAICARALRTPLEGAASRRKSRRMVSSEAP